MISKASERLNDARRRTSGGLIAARPSGIFSARSVRVGMLSFLFWTMVGLIFVLPRLASGEPLRHSILISMAAWWSWGLLSPLIVAVDRWLALGHKQPMRRFVGHLVVGPLVTLIFIYLYACMAAVLKAGPWPTLIDRELFATASQGEFLWYLLVYYLIAGVWLAYAYQRNYLSAELRMERLERSFSEARLQALRMQLDPHFLFNALNTISAQLDREPKQARRMIEHLGDLLRLSLDSSNRHEITLAEELAFLEHYLAIQKIRFGDRLNVEIDVSPEVKYAFVPSLFLQPLVENAIRHGISGRASGGSVTVSGRRRGDWVDIRVSDDGVGLPPGWSLQSPGGVGLAVTRERITGLHPQASGQFAVKCRPEGGTVIEISLPYRLTQFAHAVAAG